MTTAWFYKTLPNGEKVLRSSMVYSLSKKSLLCFCCRLLLMRKKTWTSSFVTGFKTWWKQNPKVSDHEASKEHLSCLEKWKTLAVGLTLERIVDHIRQTTMDMEKKMEGFSTLPPRRHFVSCSAESSFLWS